jgi:sulfite reductase (ferredoxin)
LFLQHGWTPADFLAAIEDRLGYKLDPAEEDNAPADIYRDHVGIHRQKQAGYCYVGAAVLRGRITAAQLRAAAEISDRLADGQLRTTNMQNLLIVNVRRERAAQVAMELETAGLHTNASPFWRGAVACTGTEFCKLAITETKGFARWLVEELEERLPGFDQQFKLNITGCPNSCGQHWIADIGLEGKKIKENGQLVDAYYFCVGGGVGRDQAIARPVGYRCRAVEVPQAIERLLNIFSDLRHPGENLRQFFARHEVNEIRAFLAGAPLPEIARDLPTERPPHGIEAV